MTDTEAGRGRGAESPTAIPARGWKDIALRVKDEFAEDHVTLTSAGVAFFAFSAFVPLLAAGVSIYGLVSDPSQVLGLVDRIEGAVPRDVADIVTEQLRSISESSDAALGWATALSVALALWAASSGVLHLIEALNIAYDEDVDDRGFVVRRGLAIAYTIGFLALTAVAVAVLRLTASAGAGTAGTLVVVAGWAVVAGIAALGLAFLYRFSPDRDDARWRWLTPGAAVAVIGLLAVSIGFRYYVANFGSYNETYGSLGAVVVLLTWLYLSALVVILGAEINAEIEHQTANDTTTGGDEPIGERDAVVADTVGETSP